MQARIGVDTGGTFTDVVLYDSISQDFHIAKVESTPGDPAVGALNGVTRILRENALVGDQVSYFCHGTTVGTNAILQNKLARAALISTSGFQDVLEIGRQRRPNQYSFHAEKLPTIIPRHLRFGVDERIDNSGLVVTPLDEESVARVARRIEQLDVESCAVCLLFSFLNPAHERRVGELLKELLPGVAVHLSCDVIQEYREYERSSSVSLNAAMAPILSTYTDRLGSRLDQASLGCELHLMKSSGGIMSFRAVEKWALQTALSGPAAGALACKYLSRLAGFPNIIGLDMGGTSCDISLVRDEEIVLTTEGRIGDYPVLVPIIDIHTIGAGGGSIAWIDVAGGLHVGPQSAGADPGPVCYGRGNAEPTVTDANLCTGRISGGNAFLGGDMRLDREAAVRAVFEHVGGPLGKDAEEAAQAIIDIVNSNMVRAIRKVTVERGVDVRDYALLAFGGGGALHCADLAKEMEIRVVIVPEFAGVLSAVGLLVADIRNDYSVTCITLLDDPSSFGRVEEVYDDLRVKALTELDAEGTLGDVVFIRALDLRYAGQSYEIGVAYAHGDTAAELRDRFELAHSQLYWWNDPKRSIEIVNVRLSAVVVVEKPETKALPLEGADSSSAVIGTRMVYCGNNLGTVSATVYQREHLRPGNVVDGLAVIESLDTTVVVPLDSWAEVDAYKNILIHVG